jgi:hypothetical protein
MPRVKISNACLKCLESENFQDRMCPVDCPDGRNLQDIFDLCYDFDNAYDSDCRHINNCQQDPRTCGYWSDRKYPIEVG